ncbi:MAG: hypothetical protein A3H93_19355 [Rhodocyclales bacterium RIFCSPLOWO2_02_FULL_63_24]|nr:MAG: hypothetical protein A3H93_19355 [Rhodocyclales bacterium RIFCSPLOWO2_02_FULL_63_24]
MNKSGPQTDQHSFSDVDANFHLLAFPARLLVWTSDAAGLCDFVSPSWTDFTGRDRSQELGLGWLDRVHPEDREVLVRGVDEARGSREPFQLLYRYLREDGVFRWFVNQGMPRSTPQGDFAGYLGLCFDVSAYQGGEAELEQSARLMISLLKQTRLIAVVLDAHGHVQFSNGGLSRLLKRSGVELVGCKLFERHLAAGNRDLLELLYPESTQNAHFPAEFESELLASDDQSHHVSWHAVVLREGAGRVKCTVLIGEDVTDLHREETHAALCARAFEATDHAMVVTGMDGAIISVNTAFTRLTGYSRDEALGNNPRMLKSGRHEQAFYEHMWATLLASDHWHGDVWDRRKDGSIYPKYLSISAIRNPSGQLTHYVGIFYDNSERRTVEERLDRLAHFDALTGMPNRCLLLDRLDQAIERAIRLGSKVALLYLDLDHFKQVNDTLGHGAGDELLKGAALRMRANVRAVDTVARLGGDEFVVLVPDIAQIEDVAIVARKLLEALTPTYELEGRAVVSTPSIGISIYPDDSRDMDELLKHADTAMYQVKQSGRSNYRFFNGASPPQ